MHDSPAVVTVDAIEQIRSPPANGEPRQQKLQHFELDDTAALKEKRKQMSLLSKIKSVSIDSKNDETLLFPGYAPVIFKYFSQKSLPRYWFLKIITRPW